MRFGESQGGLNGEKLRWSTRRRRVHVGKYIQSTGVLIGAKPAGELGAEETRAETDHPEGGSKAESIRGIGIPDSIHPERNKKEQSKREHRAIHHHAVIINQRSQTSIRNDDCYPYFKEAIKRRQWKKA